MNYKARISQFSFVFLLIAPSLLYCQQYHGIEWQKCVGGTNDDWAYSILQTSDGGYIAVGGTSSQDGDFTLNHGYDGARGHQGLDAWVIKFDSSGNLQWQECLGGTGDEQLSCIIETNDGGFIAAGYTTSFDGDVSGQHGGISPSIEYPCSDAWIVKLGADGKIEWQKCFGGESFDYANSIIQNSGKEGGYTFAGSTLSTFGDVSEIHLGKYPYYFADAWVVGLDSSGKIRWQKCLGGSDQDYAYSIIEDSDTSYVIAGSTQSSDGDVIGFHKNSDGWIAKLNDTGKIIWQRCLGGTGYTELRHIIKTNDDGYAIAGGTYCTDGDVTKNHGDEDAWIVKLDSSGIIQWQNCFGGSKREAVSSIFQTPDSGYVVAGYTSSTDENMPFNHGNGDAWIFKLNSSDSMEWQKCLGGSGRDGASSIISTYDGGYAIAGSSSSLNGDVSGQHGDSTGNFLDAWIIKLNGADKLGVPPASATEELRFSTYPNPANTQMTIQASRDIKLTNTEFFDILGRKWQCPVEAEGYHNTLIHTDKLPAGSYFMRTFIDGKNYMIPFVVQH